MTAVLTANLTWEGLKSERLPRVASANGHLFRETDTGDVYLQRNGIWELTLLHNVLATKSGNAVSDANGDATIAFVNGFIDDQYSVALTCEDPGGPPGVTAYVVSKLAGSFTIKTRQFAGSATGNVPFSWLCTRDHDP